jgi:hypothetical protein
LFQRAEALLIAGETPIVPIYFYAGFNYFDPAKIEGIYQNLLDEHPLQTIHKIRAQPRAQLPKSRSAPMPIHPL